MLRFEPLLNKIYSNLQPKLESAKLQELTNFVAAAQILIKKYNSQQAIDGADLGSLTTKITLQDQEMYKLYWWFAIYKIIGPGHGLSEAFCNLITANFMPILLNTNLSSNDRLKFFTGFADNPEVVDQFYTRELTQLLAIFIRKLLTPDDYNTLFKSETDLGANLRVFSPESDMKSALPPPPPAPSPVVDYKTAVNTVLQRYLYKGRIVSDLIPADFIEQMSTALEGKEFNADNVYQLRLPGDENGPSLKMQTLLNIDPTFGKIFLHIVLGGDRVKESKSLKKYAFSPSETLPQVRVGEFGVWADTPFPPFAAAAAAASPVIDQKTAALRAAVENYVKDYEYKGTSVKDLMPADFIEKLATLLDGKELNAENLYNSRITPLGQPNPNVARLMMGDSTFARIFLHIVLGGRMQDSSVLRQYILPPGDVGDVARRISAPAAVSPGHHHRHDVGVGAGGVGAGGGGGHHYVPGLRLYQYQQPARHRRIDPFVLLVAQLAGMRFVRVPQREAKQRQPGPQLEAQAFDMSHAIHAQGADKDADLLKDFRCPLTSTFILNKAVMVKKSNGEPQYFDSEAFYIWYNEHKTHPVTRQPLLVQNIQDDDTAEYRAKFVTAFKQQLIEDHRKRGHVISDAEVEEAAEALKEQFGWKQVGPAPQPGR